MQLTRWPLYRVRRHELLQDDGASSEDAHDDEDSQDIQQILRKLTNARFGTPEPVPLDPKDLAQETKYSPVHEEMLEFRLFAHSKSNSPVATKIRLNSPDTSNKPPGFVVPDRPRSYYFQDSWSIGEQHQFNAAAVSGSDVIQRSKTFWHGFALPWRVTTIRSDKKLVQDRQSSKPERSSSKSRKRPGKKSRIARRTLLAVAKGQVERRRKEHEAKEVAVREKKTRINKLKKMRRREKKRQEKAAAPQDPP
jgi:hypothetical protein